MPLANPLTIVSPILDNSYANFIVSFFPFSLACLEPTIAIEFEFKSSKLPSAYNTDGGLGIAFNFSGNDCPG